MRTKEELELRLEVLQEELEIEENALEPLREKIKEIEIKLSEIKFNCKIGDIVTYEGHQYRIKKFDFYWPVGNRLKKDGTFSEGIHHLYNFGDK